jgi:hypothetical protein
MKELFDGLLLYEITLLMLGVFLFLILSIGLLFYIIKKEQVKKLFFFFIFPIIMIGYPSIKEVSISKDRITLTKHQEDYMENPRDSVAKQKVEEYTAKLEKRASSPEDIVQISKSYLLLGESRKATSLADKALEKEDEEGTASEEARDIKKLAEIQERFTATPVRTGSRPAASETKPAEEATASPAETETTSTEATMGSPSATIAAPSVITTDPPGIMNNQLTTEALSAEEEKDDKEEKTLLQANPQLNQIKDIDVTQNLSKVKSFLIKKSLQNSGKESDSNK